MMADSRISLGIHNVNVIHPLPAWLCISIVPRTLSLVKMLVLVLRYLRTVWVGSCSKPIGKEMCETVKVNSVLSLFKQVEGSYVEKVERTGLTGPVRSALNVRFAARDITHSRTDKQDIFREPM